MNTKDDKDNNREQAPAAPEMNAGEHPEEKRRAPFYRALLPQKDDSRRVRIYKLLSLFFACVFIASAAYLLNDLVIQPLLSDREQADIRSMYYTSSQPAPSSSGSDESGAESAPVSSAPPERDAQGRLIRFVNLQKVNPDIVGWINLPNTNIDLPVLQANTKDPEFYLSHDYNKNSSKMGSIFADAKSKVAGTETKSIVLYGHTLNSGRMFSELGKYKSYAFFKENPLFTFDTVDNPAQWKIISVILTNTLPEQGEPFDYMKTTFKNDSDYLNFMYQLRIRSLFNTGVDFNADDQLLLLSTCSYEFDDFRLVVAARRVRTGESAAVDTSRVLYNNKTVYPDCWYRKNGGSKPVWPATYEQAVKNKVLPWSESE